MTTFRALSAMDCASQAMGRGKFSYNFEPAQKICKVGIIDLAATATTSIEEHVKLQGKLLQFEKAGEFFLQKFIIIFAAFRLWARCHDTG